ncbi:MAG: sialate O-acetylesterase [Pirellulaceae bacterium]
MTIRTKLVQISIVLLLISGACGAEAAERASKKLQVFILAGQSNMVGHANYITIPRLFADERTEVQGLAKLVFKPNMEVTRATVDKQIATKIERDAINNKLRKKEIEGADQIAAARKAMAALQADYDKQTAAIKSNFAISDSVYISSVADNSRKSGPLTVGYGGNGDKIGPELGFGMSLAEKIDAPILIIKTSWGGKSLHYNFRPPSAGPYELNEKEGASDKAADIKKNTGLNYRLMTAKVDEVLANLKDYHPAYDASAGYELAGFVWFQGFNDQFSDPFRDNYKQNMITFIKDIRQRYKVPAMPFVIGVLGTGMTAEKVAENKVSLGQRAAAEALRGDKVAAVESYQVYDLSAYEVYKKGWQNHFAEWCAVGSDRPYHYLGSGKFFVRFGDSLATAMAELMQN